MSRFKVMAVCVAFSASAAMKWSIIGLAITPFALTAQSNAPKPFALGDVFIDSNGDTLQVLNCKGEGWQLQCEVRRLAASGKAPSDPSGWWSIDTLRGSEWQWTYRGGAPYSGPAVPLPDNVGAVAGAASARPVLARPMDALPQTDVNVAVERVGGGGQCAIQRPPGSYSSTSPASEGLFRQVIFDSYAKLASGAGSAPLRVGLKFENFRQAAPTFNKVSVDPGRGARRVTDAAPPNTALHPVDATYIVCEEYYDGRKRRRISQDFYCFQDRFQDWVCGSGERFPQFTELKD